VQVCPSCGEENPAKFRLCGFCGTPLTAVRPPHEMRKTVTILFCDLKGSTDLGETLDSEALREVMARYFDEMQAILVAHGGTIEKFIGDAIMAVFGLPRLHEDDALRAVRAAVEMQRALATLNEELRRRWGVELSNRTGINTGEVVAGDPAAGQRLVTGDAVNVAARLEQAAPERDVLIGEATYRLVREAVDVEPLDPLPLKGKAEPVAAYRLLGVRAGEGFARRLDTPVVGRERELELLLQAYAGTRERQAPSLVTILGEAGVGKSRLAAEFFSRVDAEARVLRGRCLSYGEGITFWPLGEIVRQLAAIGDEDTPESGYAKLLAVLPDEPQVVERIAAVIGLTSTSFGVEDTAWATRRLLESVARDRPLVVSIEDIHWAEATFLDLIEQVVSTAADAPLLVVCSARHDLLDGRPAWGTELPGALRLALEPLTSDDSGLIVDHLLGGAQLPAGLRQRISDAAAGHPLYVEQFVSMLIDQRRLRHDEAQWILDDPAQSLSVPPTIVALLAARIDALEDDERGVVDRGSVIGQVFYRGAVEELSPEPMREGVGPALLVLTGKQLVAPGGESVAQEETFSFRHQLIRDAVYAGLLKRARAEFHERFGDWLERVAGGRLLEYEEILGYHLEQANRYRSELGPLDPDGQALGARAAARLASAGRRAFDRGDMPAAAKLLARAIALLPETNGERIELQCDLAEALLDLGELDRAQLVAAEAISAAELLGDARLVAVANLVRLLVRFVTDSAGWSDASMREAERAVPVLEEVGDHAGLARAWRLLGSVHGTACRYADAERAVQQAIDHARLATDRRQELRNLPAYAMSALYGPMPVDDAIDRCMQILEQAPGDLRTEGIVRCTLAQLQAMAGRFDEARVLYRRGRETFVELGGPLFIASTSLDSGRVELLAGDSEAALAELGPDHDALEAMGERYLRSTITALMAQAHLVAGRFEEADRLALLCEALAAPDDVEAQALWRSTRARVLADSDPETALRLASEAVDLARTTDGLVMQANALFDLAIVLSTVGQGAAAADASKEAGELYELKGHLVGAAAVSRIGTATPAPR
jgi:class 3 adenylate cyclase/tetratricopeptide (TPR) repeat protein